MIITEQTFNDTISILSNELNKDIDNILLLKLKNLYGDVCKDDYFVFKNSISIISRKMGKIESFNNDNYIKYQVKYKCSLISLNIGDTVECIVNNVNKMGVISYIKLEEKHISNHDDDEFKNSPLIIIIPNDIISNEEINFDNIVSKQKLKIEVLDLRIKYRNNKIQVVGKIVQ
jgi:DNA-directed RNA polymerase subunit E'/Rpb7